MGDHIKSDEIIEAFGGCGRYQWRMGVTVHLMKTVISFSLYSMVIFSMTPPWTCADDVTCHNVTSFISVKNGTVDITACPKKACTLTNSTSACQEFDFADATPSLVTAFQLVCERDYIPSMIMTIQMAGTLVGNLVAGQLGDLIGRKPPFFSSIVLILVSNLAGFFSVNWLMFAVARFFTGLGAGFFLTPQYSLLSEFAPAKWRVWLIGFPSWPLQICLLALLAWLIQDWRYTQLMIAILCVPCLFAWWIVPESFRWYIANDKPERAMVIIKQVAEYNGKTMDKIEQLIQKPKDTDSTKRYTFLDLFKSRHLVWILFLFSLNWGAIGLVSYGINFGIQALAGSVYFNLFLFNIVGVPTKAISMWVQNRFGRRTATIICHGMIAIGGFIVGVVQTVDAPHKDTLTTAFALLAYIGVMTAYGPVQTMTIELLPTAVRNVGFGFLSVFSRLAAMVGPQLVYADAHSPGVLYYACGAISTVCIVACIFLPESKDTTMEDKIGKPQTKVAPLQETYTKTTPV